MRKGVNIDDFEQQKECAYKGERYSVRDNGAILRHHRPQGRSRKMDNVWTFGNVNTVHGYMEISSVRVHQVVATAFHDEKPTGQHVVDHIDTNKRNNRPENLRWVTRLENALLNPITARRIEIVCGSIEAFLENPKAFWDKFPNPNDKWMGTVSKAEAEISHQRLLAWATSKKMPSGGSLGDWIFKRPLPDEEKLTEYNENVDLNSKTENAIQRNWKTPSEFPCCPQTYEGNPILTYAENLKPGLLLCRNELYSSVVLKTAVVNDDQEIYVMTESESSLKRWAIAKITFEDGKFVHTSIQNFFSQNGAEKQFTIAQGLEWNGEDSIDDYC